MNTKYFAIPDFDYYSVVEVITGRSQHEQEIEITKEQYESLLRANQKFGHMIRARVKDGSIEMFSCEEQKPSQYHEWSVELGKWIIDEELKRKQQSEEIEQRIAHLRGEIIYLAVRGKDTSEAIREIEECEGKLEELLKEM